MSHSDRSARQPFSSQWVFVLAAVGSAAGLGNLWRFPYLAYENGGGAFLVAYVACLFLVGATLLILEAGLGQLTGSSAPRAMAKTHRKGYFRFVGWLAVVMTFFIMQYYTVITGWAVNYAVRSPQLPWTQDSANYFYHHFLHLSANIDAPRHIVWPILIGAAAIYVLLFLFAYRGTKGIAYVAKWITPIPIVLIVLLALNSLTLPGSAIGLHYYFSPKWSVLLHDDVWFAAASQVFFSLSIGFGVMFSYGALLKKELSVRYTAMAIITGDSFVAFFGGIIVYAVLGYLAAESHTSIHEVIKGGIGLAFVVIPQALALLPFFAKSISFLFYFSLICLAFTSIVSMSEAILGAFADTHVKLSRTMLLFGISVLGCAGGIIYAQTNGLYVLDLVDHYVSGYVLLSIGLLEVILIGWCYDAKRLRSELAEQTPARISSLFTILVRFLMPALLIALLAKEIYDDFQVPYGGFSVQDQLVYGVLPICLIVILAAALTKWCRLASIINNKLN